MNLGDRYGRYEIVRLLGRGAMGEVYLARDTELAREVALKIVYKGPHPEDQEILDAERLGAELQKRLSGAEKRVVVVNRYGEIAGDLFIEMEYIEGEDLAAVLLRGPVQHGFAVHVARELCEMLENLRTFTTTIGDRQFVGIVHGDLKPRNIRLSPQNQVKVLDFGIAKALSHTRRYTLNVFASTAYCSPERLETQNMDAQSDLWSVGVLLYQMIAGRLPFDETTKERMERRIRSSDPPNALPPECPEPLARIIFQMLARDPGRRYQSANDVKQDLARFQAGEQVSAEPIAASVSDGEATVRTSPLAMGSDQTSRTVDDRTGRSPGAVVAPLRRRSNNALGCLAAFGGVCLVLIVFSVMQVNFWNDADRLKADLDTERVTNVDEAWNRYQALASRRHLSMLLWGAKSALKRRLVAGAESIIAEYRNSDAPTVYAPQWSQARTWLARALELDPDDKGIKGRLRLCEAHLDRIEAAGLRGTARQKKLNAALANFSEAADLLKHSPDPYLGLARLYVYELNDVEKAEDALNMASKYGHPMGKRETAQLADGYRRRADRIWRESRSFANLPAQERDYLDKARRDYMHAEDLYEQAGLFGDVARNELQAIQGQQRVEQRLSQLQGSAVAQ